MPVDAISNIEWLNANSQRAYPLTLDASKKDITGSFTLPDDLLVDFIMSVHMAPTIYPGHFHVSGLNIFNRGITILFGYDGVDIASINIPFATHTLNTAYYFQGTGDFYDAYGHAIIGSVENTQAGAVGAFTFDLAGGQLQPGVIRPDIRGITSLTLTNGDDTSDPIYGDVVFVAGTNMRLTPITTVEGTQIRFDAINGEGLTADCECDNITDAPPIRTINGIPPDPTTGNFVLTGSECIDIQAATNGLELEDKCSEPCCGCKELELLTTQLQGMATQLTTLENFAARLMGNFEQFNLNVLASRLSNIPCEPS